MKSTLFAYKYIPTFTLLIQDQMRLLLYDRLGSYGSKEERKNVINLLQGYLI